MAAPSRTLPRFILLAAALFPVGLALAENAPAAPAPNISQPAGNWTMTADYYGYQGRWAAFDSARALFGPDYQYDSGITRKGSLYGGTISGTFGRFAVDLSYREGSSDLTVFNRDISKTSGGEVYSDTVKFQDKVYEGRLRYNLGSFGGFRGYLALGVSRNELNHHYSYLRYSLPGGSGVNPPKRQDVPELSGDATADFITAGYGLTRGYQLEPSVFFFPKFEGALLGGSQNNNYPSTSLLKGKFDNFVYGAEATTTGRFSVRTGDSSTLSLELGGKWRYIDGESAFGGVSWGYFARAAIQFSY